MTTFQSFEELTGKESVLDRIDRENGKMPRSTEQVLENAIKFFTDKIHLAEQFVSILPTYYDTSNNWWMWDFAKCCYVEIDEIDLLNKIDNASEANIVVSKERSEILNALRQIARRKEPKPIEKSWIQFNEDVVDINTGNRFKATTEYFFVNPLPYKIGKSEETPTMDRIFAEWVGDKNVILLYEIVAYCLIRDYPLERIFCFIGSGSNGKSCFLKLIREFIGDYNTTTTDLLTLLRSRFETAKLRNKLAVILGETNFDTLDNTQLLKRLVSGKDPIPIEYKHRGQLDYINYAKVLISTNNLPATNDKTAGWFRRWIIIDFPFQFDESKDILQEIPKEEYENLSLKAIGLLIKILTQRKMTNEGSIIDRQRKYEEKSYPIERFMREFTCEDFDGHIWKGEFEKKLNQWCKENKHREMSEVAIGKKMKEKGIQQRLLPADWLDGKQCRAWVGIKFTGGNEEKSS